MSGTGPARAQPLLVAEGLRKSFGDAVVLDDVSLHVAPHDVVCLIGASGSGGAAACSGAVAAGADEGQGGSSACAAGSTSSSDSPRPRIATLIEVSGIEAHYTYVNAR